MGELHLKSTRLVISCKCTISENFHCLKIKCKVSDVCQILLKPGWLIELTQFRPVWFILKKNGPDLLLEWSNIEQFLCNLSECKKDLLGVIIQTRNNGMTQSVFLGWRNKLIGMDHVAGCWLHSFFLIHTNYICSVVQCMTFQFSGTLQFDLQ